MDFNQAVNTVIGEITPQPWDYTTPDGVTLTAIPAGLRADPGEAEILIQITVDKTLAAQLGITTADLPALIDALTDRHAWDYTTILDSLITVTSPGGDGVLLIITETVWEDRDNHAVSTSICLPEAQRLPFVSALRRAADVARGWED